MTRTFLLTVLVAFGIRFVATALAREDSMAEMKAWRQQARTEVREPASDFDPDPYIDIAKQIKPSYLKVRCPPLKPFSDPLFADFENNGLTPGELRDQIDKAIVAAQAAKLVPVTPLTPRPSDAELDAAIAALEKLKAPLELARQTPVVRESRLKCAADCGNQQIRCSVLPGLAGPGWQELPPI